ncbi:Metallothiol transferase FosB [Grimontia celer]|uniref:Metallothiol transferase FosB n=1 Tax=Grimontia celer TaxID=1796497 RepID=A0A128F7D8_9GAMM|nr:VOC family protein [Grimontia celer]CZF82400.1 Metallothiol transferase FosB [Grimontia celer]
MIQGIHHVALIASDIEVSKRFYRDILGFKIIAEHYREERDSWKVDVLLPDGRQLEMFSFPGSPTRPSFPEAQGLRHLAFQTLDIDFVIAHLQKHGVDCEAVRTDPYTQSRFTFFQDPDGLPLELYEMTQ